MVFNRASSDVVFTLKPWCASFAATNSRSLFVPKIRRFSESEIIHIHLIPKDDLFCIFLALYNFTVPLPFENVWKPCNPDTGKILSCNADDPSVLSLL